MDTFFFFGQWVLHDWGKDDCIKILEKCKDAISSNGKRGKIIIIDVIINEKRDGHEITQLKLKMDINMTCVNGKQRNEEELKELFTEAGFQDYKISSLPGFFSLVEVYP